MTRECRDAGTAAAEEQNVQQSAAVDWRRRGTMIHLFKASGIKPHAQLRGSHPMTYPFPLSRIVLEPIARRRGR